MSQETISYLMSAYAQKRTFDERLKLASSRTLANVRFEGKSRHWECKTLNKETYSSNLPSGKSLHLDDGKGWATKTAIQPSN